MEDGGWGGGEGGWSDARDEDGRSKSSGMECGGAGPEASRQGRAGEGWAKEIGRASGRERV